MKRNEFNNAVTDMGCIPGGLKEACLIAKEYLRHYTGSEKDGSISANGKSSCAVTGEEFLEATRLLLAHTWPNAKTDYRPILWNCENDCIRCSETFCDGEFRLASNKTKVKRICKYYIEEDK